MTSPHASLDTSSEVSTCSSDSLDSREGPEVVREREHPVDGYERLTDDPRGGSSPGGAGGGAGYICAQESADLRVPTAGDAAPRGLKPAVFDPRGATSGAEPIDLTPEGAYSMVSATGSLSLDLASTPLREEGQVSLTGGQIMFVADDLSEKIKLSSPGSRRDSTSSVPSHSGLRTASSSNYSISSASSGPYASSMSTRSISGLPVSLDIPPIDPKMLDDLEAHTQKVSDNLDLMLGNLKGTLHKMSAITGACTDVYKEAVDNMCDTVDSSIKSMYALMAKCEELSAAMKPIAEMQEQVKEIKRLLEMFEAQVIVQD